MMNKNIDSINIIIVIIMICPFLGDPMGYNQSTYDHWDKNWDHNWDNN